MGRSVHGPARHRERYGDVPHSGFEPVRGERGASGAPGLRRRGALIHHGELNRRGSHLQRAFAKQTLHDINRISSGDLSGKIAIHGDDELGMVTQALRILQINVKLLVGQIQQVTEIINSSTSKIVTDDDAALCSESCPCKHSVSELAAARQKKAASACHH